MKKNDQKYLELLQYVNGKSVAVVGSSACLLNNNHGKEIDDHDRVVRINRGIPYERYQIHVGSKTNILSWGMGGDQENRYRVFDTLKDEVTYFMYHWWDHTWVPQDIASSEKHLFIPKEFSMSAASYCGNKPATTGADCVYFFVTGTECKEISIYGIDFYKSGYFFIEEDSSIIPKVVSDEGKVVHDSNEEEKFLNNLVITNNKLRWVK